MGQSRSASKMDSPTATFTQLSKNAFLVSAHHARFPFYPPTNYMSLNPCIGHQLVPLLPLRCRLPHKSLHPNQCVPPPACGRLAHASYVAIARWHGGYEPTFRDHYVAHTRMGTDFQICRASIHITMTLFSPDCRAISIQRTKSSLIENPIAESASPLLDDFRHRS